MSYLILASQISLILIIAAMLQSAYEQYVRSDEIKGSTGFIVLALSTLLVII